jgi:prephenate dehydratase/chorismate mutase/prephenate dehydratase
MDLKNIRNHIDILDAKILNLLNERMEQAIMTKKFKEQIEDGEREKEIFQRIVESYNILLDPKFCKKLFVEIIAESKNLQSRDNRIIAFQGEHGAYGEIAAKNWNGDVIPVPCKEFIEIFDGVESGLYDFGIVPIENTLGGVVGEVNELLIGTKLYIIGAVDLSISHCLIALPGITHREIRKVYSHPQALAQCRNFLRRNNLEPISYYDTAGAVKMLTEKNLEDSAAIASNMAAKIYGLEIIKEHLEDSGKNNTRFAVLSKEANDEQGEKCSILFSTEHKAGTLFKVLEVFAKANINLTKIESVPERPGNYAFFLDFLGSDKDENVIDSIEKVQSITQNFRLLGCYKERKVG